MVLGGSAWSSLGSVPGAVRVVSYPCESPTRPDAAPLRRAVSEVGLGLKGEKERAEKLQQAAVGDKGVQQVLLLPEFSPICGWLDCEELPKWGVLPSPPSPQACIEIP